MGIRGSQQDAVQGQSNSMAGALNMDKGGFDGIIDPTMAPPHLWIASANVHRLQNNVIRRARFADVIVAGTTTGLPVTSSLNLALYPFEDPTQQLLLSDWSNNKHYAHEIVSSYDATERVNPFHGSGVSAMGGLWSRAAQFNVVYEMNGTVKQKASGALLTAIKPWGITNIADAPTVTLSAGAITKTTGRKYTWAWVDPNTLPRLHVSKPSPETAFQVYSSQQGKIECIAVGTISTTISSATVTGVGTNFTNAMIGQQLWIESGGNFGYITAVASTTSLTLKVVAPSTQATKKYQVFDGLSTSLEVRLYATSDGGATFLRVQNNTFDPTQTTVILAGLEFTDNDNNEPPDGNFTLETEEFNNDPPPVGTFVKEWQGRILVFGKSGDEQSVFYSNIEFTVFGVPTESFAPLNSIRLPIGSAKISAAAVVPTGLVLFSDQEDMFKITGLLQDNDVVDDFAIGSTIRRLPYKHGCAHHTAITETPYGIFWVSPENRIHYWDDLNQPVLVSLPIQNLMYNGIVAAKVKMTYYRDEIAHWLVVAVAQSPSTTNDKLLFLDLDSLKKTGQFDWYQYDLDCEGLTTLFGKGSLQQRLLVGGTDVVQDAVYNGTAFKVGAEKIITGANVKFHQLGNDTPQVIKQLKMLRVHTNRTPAQFETDGWSIKVHGVGDDVFTLASPLTRTLTPGTDSPTAAQANQFIEGPNLFKFGGTNFLHGRGIQFEVIFPNGLAQFDLQQLSFIIRSLPPR